MCMITDPPLTDPPIGPGYCPPGWVSYGSYCYFFEANRLFIWQDAVDECYAMGAAEVSYFCLGWK